MTGIDWKKREFGAVRERLDEFRDRVYWLTDQIPAGRVATYGQIALYAGSPKAARATGNVLKGSTGRGVEIPWHRVINSKGGISYKSDVERARIQRQRLEAEGVVFDGKTCQLEMYRWDPPRIFWGEKLGL